MKKRSVWRLFSGLWRRLQGIQHSPVAVASQRSMQTAVAYFESGKIVCPFAKGGRMMKQVPAFRSPEFLEMFPGIIQQFEAAPERALILIPPDDWKDKAAALGDMKQLVFNMYVADDLIKGVHTSPRQALEELIKNNPDFLGDTTDDIQEPLVVVNNTRYFVSGLAPFYNLNHYRYFPCSIAVIVDFAEIEEIRNKSPGIAQKIQLEAAARGYLARFDNIAGVAVEDVVAELGLWQAIDTMIREGSFGVAMGEKEIREYVLANKQGQLPVLKTLLEQNPDFPVENFIRDIRKNFSSLVV